MYQVQESAPQPPPTPSEIRQYIAHEYAIFAEYAELSRNPCDGVFVVPSDSSPSLWQGTMVVIEGPYDGAVLRFTLSFQPSIVLPQLPRLVFASPIFHPLVDSKSGEFDLEFLFPQWSNKIRMRDVLQAVRDAFAVVNSAGQRNTEAAALCAESPTDFRIRVFMDIVDTMQELTNENSSLSNSQMNFGPWIPELHEPILRDLLSTGATILEEKKTAAAKKILH